MNLDPSGIGVGLSGFPSGPETAFAFVNEENNLGVRCVSVPVRDSTGRIRAALGASGTTSAFPTSAIPQMAKLALDTAKAISEELGYGI